MTVVPPGAGVAAPAASAGVGAGPAATITLLTGDKVTLTGPHGAVVEPAKGRERIRFVQQRDESGDLHVIPEDALRMLRAHRIDPRLFNVGKLAQNNYDDKSRNDIPLIVSGTALARTKNKVRDLPSIGGAAIRVDKTAGFGPLESAQHIWLDGPVQAMLDHSVPQIGAPQAWQSGYTGKGTTVAVLDTGIDATHPDLADAVVQAQNFTPSQYGADDHFGHGTHVASIITGRHEKYTGVAPDTKLLNGKVLSDGGGGQDSWIIAGMEWAAAQHANVINMSLGSRFPSDGNDALSLAANRLTAESGSLFVVASGNSGGTPGSPAAADAALTVGAVDRNDQLAPFSSRGPRFGDDAIKPDITAPGVDIAAAKATHGLVGTPVDETHVRLSGTSMAAPHVAGAAAILAGEHPGWQAGELKAALMNSAKPDPARTVFDQGAGRVDVAKAVAQNVYSSPATISEGIARWPHNDDTPITTTVTYHNSGTSAVVLDLRTDIRGPDGNPAPAGMFTLSPSTVSVPAGGQAQVTLTTDTRVTAPDGLYSGVLLAGETRIPVAVNREVESYDVKLEFLGFDGTPTPDYTARLINIDTPKTYQPYDASGTVTTRLPKGRYYIDVVTQGTGKLALAAEPEYVVDKPGTLTIDARDGKPAGFVVDQPNAQCGEGNIGFARVTKTPGGASTDIYTRDFTDVVVRPSTSVATAAGQFRYYTEARMAEPDGKGTFNDSPYLYSVHHETDGRVPADLVDRIHDNELTKVRSEHAATGAGKYGMRERMVLRQLPFTLQEFYTPNVPWLGRFSQTSDPILAPAESGLSSVGVRTFAPGHATERWNNGVFGPAFPADPEQPWAWASRYGDQVTFQLPLYADRAPHRYGFSDSSGTTTLSLDGKQIGTTPYPGFADFTVPAGPASYQLHTDSARDTPMSSKVTADWTFKSTTVTGDNPEALPLLAVRFAPLLDDHNQAPRLLPTLVPVTVDHNAGGTAGKPVVQVSYDDGATWKPVVVLTIAGRWFTLIAHPPRAGSVSLKAKASDTNGNAVEQTIIGAFFLK
ncbi:S8 family serine peptidase [Actinocrispum sp. NPDC049592]|uniref:S8 family peptidase n=1 Tax=Actinocrispum sp. NPDC049592 TaxID=3154835 RepID=UPI00343BEC07